MRVNLPPAAAAAAAAEPPPPPYLIKNQSRWGVAVRRRAPSCGGRVASARAAGCRPAARDITAPRAQRREKSWARARTDRTGRAGRAGRGFDCKNAAWAGANAAAEGREEVGKGRRTGSRRGRRRHGPGSAPRQRAAPSAGTPSPPPAARAPAHAACPAPPPPLPQTHAPHDPRKLAAAAAAAADRDRRSTQVPHGVGDGAAAAAGWRVRACPGQVASAAGLCRGLARIRGRAPEGASANRLVVAQVLP